MTKSVILGLAALFLLGATVNCTKYASPDDLQKLEEAKRAAQKAKQDQRNQENLLKAHQDTLKMVQDSIAAAQTELDKVKSRKAQTGEGVE